MMIPYGKQNVILEDIQSVVDVLRSPYLTQGPIVPLFEQKLCENVMAKFAVAVNSATSALHLAVKALGLSHGDIVWTSPISFVASANCVLYCKAHIDFVDIDPLTFNMCPNALEEKLKNADANGTLPKIVIVVHMAGQSADMSAIQKLSQKYNFKIIEDASHAIGGTYQNDKIGCCKFSDITIFSFHPVKIITTGEGGVAVTNDKKIAEKMSLLRSHGITRDIEKLHDNQQGDWYYEMQELGFNYRLTDIQAALGVSQMSRLHEIVRKRNEIASVYNDTLDQNHLILPKISEKCLSSFHLYIVRMRDASLRHNIFQKLRGKGIGVNVHYIPIHLQPFYQKLGFKKGDYPLAERYYDQAISIPIYPELMPGEQQFVASALNGEFA